MTVPRSLLRERPHARADQVPLLPRRYLIGGICASLMITVALLIEAGLHIALDRAFVVFGLLAVFAIMAHRLAGTIPSRRARIVRDLVEGIALFSFVSLLGAIASYALAAGHHAFVDGDLQRVDHTLHFDWPGLYDWVANHPWLQTFERCAYLSIFVSPGLVIAGFALSRRQAECRLFVATFWVTALFTLSLFPLMPAAGPFATLWHGQAPYMPLSGLYQEKVISALRDRSLHTIRLGQLHGLVCAPSFHAASAILYIASAYRIPLIRWPVIVVSIAMLGATPVEGTHYLADLLAGVLVALFALWLTPLLIRLAEAADQSRQTHRQSDLVAAE